jgi:hypothetical protein
MESECLSGEIAQRKALLKKIDEEDMDVTKVASQCYGNTLETLLHKFVEISSLG